MQNQNAGSQSPPLNWKDWLHFLSPDGQQQIVDFIRQAREDRGRNWLPEIKAEFPMVSWLADLVANKTADQAIGEVAEMFPLLPVRFLAAEKIRSLHARLLHEIEVKR